MPMVPSPDLTNTILVVLEISLAILGGFIAALWISLVIWTFRDIRSRSRDIFAQLLATLLVLLLNLPGLLVYILLRPPERLADAYERALEEEALLQDIEERLLCPGCKRQVKDDYILCPSCHTSLKKQCVRCGRILHLKWDLCPYCAADQIEDAPRSEEPAPAYVETNLETAYTKSADAPAPAVAVAAAEDQESLWPAEPHREPYYETIEEEDDDLTEPKDPESLE
jgi:RNA polymerase subunit RPABC4/transcription elongation factor Spt4